MTPIVETTSTQAADLGFSVSSQKVELDIDLRSRSLLGHTEITINPHSKDLRVIRINCRQAIITRVTLNRKPCQTALTYKDPYTNAKLEWNSAGVQQYDMLQRKLEGQLKDPPEEDLEVTIPKTVKIEDLDPFSDEAQNVVLSKTLGNGKRNSGDGSAIDLAQSSRTAIEQTARFTQIKLDIHYEIRRIRDGMHFVGWEEGDLRYPHAYTTNRPSPGAACCLFPCVDNLNAKCNSEIFIKCQNTIGDALRQGPSSNLESRTDSLNGVWSSNSTSGSSRQPKFYDQCNSFSDADKALDLAVICTGDMTNEVRIFDLLEYSFN